MAIGTRGHAEMWDVRMSAICRHGNGVLLSVADEDGAVCRVLTCTGVHRFGEPRRQGVCRKDGFELRERHSERASRRRTAR